MSYKFLYNAEKPSSADTKEKTLTDDFKKV